MRSSIATQVLDLKATEILVLHASGNARELADLRAQLSSLIPEAVRSRVAVVVLAPGMVLEALSHADLTRLGLVRVS